MTQINFPIMKHFLLFEKRGVMKARHLACSDRKVKKKSHLIYNLNFSMCACTKNVMSVAVSIGTIKITFFIEAPKVVNEKLTIAWWFSPKLFSLFKVKEVKLLSRSFIHLYLHVPLCISFLPVILSPWHSLHNDGFQSCEITAGDFHISNLETILSDGRICRDNQGFVSFPNCSLNL